MLTRVGRAKIDPIDATFTSFEHTCIRLYYLCLEVDSVCCIVSSIITFTGHYQWIRILQQKIYRGSSHVIKVCSCITLGITAVMH